MDHLTEREGKSIRSLSRRERRHAVRVEIYGEVHAQAAALDLPVLLLDISETGFSMHSTFDFLVDSTHDFRFIVAADPPASVVLTARVIHTTVRTGGNRKPSYIAGLEFMDRTDERVDLAIHSLLTIVRASQGFGDPTRDSAI
jgi:hypothetical protein